MHWTRFIWILAALEILVLLYFETVYRGVAGDIVLVVLMAPWDEPERQDALWSAMRWVNLLAILGLWVGSRRPSRSGASVRGHHLRRWVVVGWAVLLLTLSVAARRIEPAMPQPPIVERVIDCSESFDRCVEHFR